MKTTTCLAGFAGIIILNLGFTSCATPPAPAPAPAPTPASSKHATAARAAEPDFHPEIGDWKLALQEGGD
jgi:hypothetical protein